MNPEISALIISDGAATVAGLRRHLENLCATVRTVRSCGDAVFYLWSACPPHVVFTDTQLPDGTWSDVLAVAKKSPAAVSVVVISQLVDMYLYVETMEKGAYDFMVSPKEALELEHVLRSAAANALNGRRSAAEDRKPPEVAGAFEAQRNLKDGPVEDDAELLPTL